MKDERIEPEYHNEDFMKTVEDYGKEVEPSGKVIFLLTEIMIDLKKCKHLLKVANNRNQVK